MTAITDPEVIKALTDAGGQLWQKKGKRRIWTTIDVLFTMAGAIPEWQWVEERLWRYEPASKIRRGCLLSLTVGDVTVENNLWMDTTRMGLNLDTGVWKLTTNERIDALLMPALEGIMADPVLATAAARRNSERQASIFGKNELERLDEKTLLALIAQNIIVDGRNVWTEIISRRKSLPGSVVEALVAVAQQESSEQDMLHGITSGRVLSEATIESLISTTGSWWKFEGLLTQAAFPYGVFQEFASSAEYTEDIKVTFAAGGNPQILAYIASHAHAEAVRRNLHNNPSASLETLLAVSGGRLSEALLFHKDLTDDVLAGFAKTESSWLLTGPKQTLGTLPVGAKTHAALLEGADPMRIQKVVERDFAVTSAEQLDEWSKSSFARNNYLKAILRHQNVSTQTIANLTRHQTETVSRFAEGKLKKRGIKPGAEVGGPSYLNLAYYLDVHVTSDACTNAVSLKKIRECIETEYAAVSGEFSLEVDKAFSSALALVRDAKQGCETTATSERLLLHEVQVDETAVDLRGHRRIQSRINTLRRDLAIVHQQTVDAISELALLEFLLESLVEKHAGPLG